MDRFIKLIILCILLSSCSLFEDDNRMFSTESWTSDPDTRYEMIDDLLDNYLYVGMSKSEVIYLLGEPDSNSSAYYLGYPGYNIDPEILQILYENDQISSIWVGEG